MQSDHHLPQPTELAARSTREGAYRRDTRDACAHCGGTHRLMEICPAAPGAIELVRQYIHGYRTPMHLLAVGGIVTLAVLWTVAVISVLLA